MLSHRCGAQMAHTRVGVSLQAWQRMIFIGIDAKVLLQCSEWCGRLARLLRILVCYRPLAVLVFGVPFRAVLRTMGHTASSQPLPGL